MHDQIWCNYEDVNINLKHKHSISKYTVVLLKENCILATTIIVYRNSKSSSILQFY